MCGVFLLLLLLASLHRMHTYQGRGNFIFHCNSGVDIIIVIVIAVFTHYGRHRVQHSFSSFHRNRILLGRTVNFACIFLTTIKNVDYFSNNNNNKRRPENI